MTQPVASYRRAERRASPEPADRPLVSVRSTLTPGLTPSGNWPVYAPVEGLQ